ncbi:MAG TPA: hypothetical protein VN549_06185 [Negativicutes bacterium]|nr:hypothetical protein [Negativicutes bacterium]
MGNEGECLMDITEARNIIGREVIASDEYWGAYRGILVEVFKTPVAPRAKVQIERNLRYPSQQAIFFPENIVTRMPYEKGSIKNFDLTEVKVIEEAEG